MITRQNLEAVILDLGAEAIIEALDGDQDFIAVNLHTSNSGSFATIENVAYDSGSEEYAQKNGNIYCDKETFGMMVDEVGLTELINP